MRITYFDNRKDMIMFFVEKTKRSFGYFDISPSGDFFKTSEVRWHHEVNEMFYPSSAVLFNVMKDDRIEFESEVFKLSCQ